MSDIYNKLLEVYRQHPADVSAYAGWNVKIDEETGQWVKMDEPDGVCILGAACLGQEWKQETDAGGAMATAARLLGLTHEEARAVVYGFDDGLPRPRGYFQDPRSREAYEAGANIAALARGEIQP